jgi:uncharacterized membrane protein
MKLITLFSTVILTGLSAGFFYAWAVSVIPGTKKIADLTYLETMQSINKEILNPMFFLIFFGCLITMIISAIQQFGNGTVFWMIIFAGTTYLVGTFGVTALGNVPLNNQLEALSLGDLNKAEIIKWREYYEPVWNRLHTIRTVFSVISFYLILHAAYLMFSTKI